MFGLLLAICHNQEIFLLVDDDSARSEKSKASNPSSMLSLLVETSQKAQKKSGGSFVDEMFDPLLGGSSKGLGFTPLASQWCNVATDHLQNSIIEALNVEASSDDLESMKKTASDFCEGSYGFML